MKPTHPPIAVFHNPSCGTSRQVLPPASAS